MQLDAKCVSVLQKLVGVELRNGIVYLEAYSWLRANGWEGFSKRMKNAAFEEFAHAQNWIKYLARRGETCPALVASHDGGMPDSPLAAAEREQELEESTEAMMRLVVEVATETKEDGLVEYASGKLVEQEKDTKRSRDFAVRIAEAAKQSGALVILDRDCERRGW